MSINNLLNVMRQISKPDPNKQTDIVGGVVTSANPLKIFVDSRFTIDEDFLILGDLCKEYKKENIELLINNEPATIKEFTFWKDLEVGETVKMLRFNQGQMFLVFDRGKL